MRITCINVRCTLFHFLFISLLSNTLYHAILPRPIALIWKKSYFGFVERGCETLSEQCSLCTGVTRKQVPYQNGNGVLYHNIHTYIHTCLRNVVPAVQTKQNISYPPIHPLFTCYDNMDVSNRQYAYGESLRQPAWSSSCDIVMS